MLKLFATLIVFLLLALAMLGLRHHRMELTAQTARLRDQIRQQEHVLGDQRVQIAKVTNPLVLTENLKKAGIDGAGIPPPPEAPLGMQIVPAVPGPVDADLAPPHAGGIVTVSSDTALPRTNRHRMAH
jgi:hypothetical protein